MSHLKLLLFMASFSCLFCECKKGEEDKLPPATASGAGTFGCLINGKAWPGNTKDYQDSYVSYSSGVLIVEYYTMDDPFSATKNGKVSIITNKVQQPGTYYISYINRYDDIFLVMHGGEDYASSDKINKYGYATITISRLDSIFHYIAGTFSFSPMYDMSGTSKVEVTKGRFDLRY